MLKPENCPIRDTKILLSMLFSFLWCLLCEKLVMIMCKNNLPNRSLKESLLIILSGSIGSLAFSAIF